MVGEKNILIVEDNQDARETIKELLKESYPLWEAANGEEALKILEQSSTKIALILLDIRMPVMDGLQLIKKINELKYQNRIIMITAYDEVENWLDSILSYPQVIGFIVKPYTGKELKETVDLFFQGKERYLRTTAIEKFEEKMWPKEKPKNALEALKTWAKNIDVTDSRKTPPHSEFLKYI